MKRAGPRQRTTPSPRAARPSAGVTPTIWRKGVASWQARSGPSSSTSTSPPTSAPLSKRVPSGKRKPPPDRDTGRSPAPSRYSSTGRRAAVVRRRRARRPGSCRVASVPAAVVAPSRGGPRSSRSTPLPAGRPAATRPTSTPAPPAGQARRGTGAATGDRQRPDRSETPAAWPASWAAPAPRPAAPRPSCRVPTERAGSQSADTPRASRGEVPRLAAAEPMHLHDRGERGELRPAREALVVGVPK